MGDTVNLSKTTINLSKGETINLSKNTPSENLKNIRIGLGWDPVGNDLQVKEVNRIIEPGFIGRLLHRKARTVTEAVALKNAIDIDCDAWVMLAINGKILSTADVIFYNNLIKYNGKTKVITHHGDNLTGEGQKGSDKEQITVNLNKLQSKYDAIIIGFTIYEGEARHQSLVDVKNKFIRIVDTDTNFEVCRFDSKDMEQLDEESSRTFIAGRITRDNKGWKFTAIGRCMADDHIFNVVDRLRAESIEY